MIYHFLAPSLYLKFKMLLQDRIQLVSHTWIYAIHFELFYNISDVDYYVLVLQSKKELHVATYALLFIFFARQ
jgi:hypothetical protein